MDLYSARCPDWLRAAVSVGLLALLLQHHSSPAQAQSPQKIAASIAPLGGVRDVRSSNFLIHTDLSTRKANELVEQLETMLRRISAYWGRPVRGKIECYVVSDFNNFSLSVMDLRGLGAIKTAGGATLMDTALMGRRYQAKSVVYANTQPEVARHEVIHAYCYQTFGRVGPIWYSEGMAEMGHYWENGDLAVHAGQREIHFLGQTLPTSLAETLSESHVTGDSWQNYASRWALCHFLVNNPNYSQQFRTMGRGILVGKGIHFDQVYGAISRELWFEYLLFLQHIGRGYRVDLCAWDWNRRFACLQPKRTVTATIMAGRGWQPTGVTILPEMQYEYVAKGNWQIASQPETIDANGDDHARGRLVGVLMKDYQLGTEFDMGSQGMLQLRSGGDLYLRCRSSWTDLAHDSGHVTVRLKRKDDGTSLKVAVPVVTAGGSKPARTN